MDIRQVGIAVEIRPSVPLIKLPFVYQANGSPDEVTVLTTFSIAMHMVGRDVLATTAAHLLSRIHFAHLDPAWPARSVAQGLR